MLFQGLNKLKRQSIMTAIMYMAAGMILIIWPGEYVVTLMKTVSWLMLVWSMVLIMDYVKSEKSVMDYVWLCAALALGILGMWIAVFDVDTLGAVAWVFGLLLIIDGLHGAVHAMIYSRRSGRKGWWILMILSLVILVFGILTICHPWWPAASDLLHAIGLMIICAAALSALRLLWIWPLKSE